MRSHKSKEHLANILAEAKYLEKQVDKLRVKLEPLETTIKRALKSGNRELAMKYALQLEELKDEIKKGEAKVALARRQYESGKVKAKEFESTLSDAKTMGKLAENMQKIAGSMDVLTRDDDALRKVEEEIALTEARLEIAMEGADSLPLEPELPPANSAEDILKEFE